MWCLSGRDMLSQRTVLQPPGCGRSAPLEPGKGPLYREFEMDTRSNHIDQSSHQTRTPRVQWSVARWSGQHLRAMLVTRG